MLSRATQVARGARGGGTDTRTPSRRIRCSRAPYTLDFGGADGGKNAHYMSRRRDWVNTKGEKGPWSETAMAMVGPNAVLVGKEVRSLDLRIAKGTALFAAIGDS